jgi:hypothetical protein
MKLLVASISTLPLHFLKRKIFKPTLGMIMSKAAKKDTTDTLNESPKDMNIKK